MTIRFFILQSHYRSTLDFGSTALEASEKALKRLWEAYEVLQKISIPPSQPATDKELDEKIVNLVNELDEFMDDDLALQGYWPICLSWHLSLIQLKMGILQQVLFRQQQ
jgi:cysteinyl-tRNA synthetase